MFYYYGAKTALAAHYPAPVHRTVVEPFAGSAAYAVRAMVEGVADRAVLCDRDPRIVDIWMRLLAMTPDEVLALPPVVAGVRTSDPLHWVVATSNSWGALRNYMTVTPRMVAGWESMKRKIAASLPHMLGRTEVYLGDYADTRQAGPATYFIDPPYQVVQRDDAVRTAFPRGMGYMRGCNSAALDFPALGRWCESLKGQVIATEQEGADWLPFKPLRDAHDSQGVRRGEVVWINNERTQKGLAA